MKNLIKNYGLYAVWAIALVATLGSLYFSEILKLPPCYLCWYQRIAMYPLVIIGAVGIIKKDVLAWSYLLPFAVVGWFVALFHNLLYYKILPEAAVPCVAGISCTSKQLQLFGFLDIPLMSLTAFTGIMIILVAYAWTKKNEQRS